MAIDDPNDAAPTDGVVTVYVNDRAVHLPGAVGDMWSVPEIARKAAAAGIVSHELAAEVTPLCRNPPCGTLRVQLHGGEKFDLHTPRPASDRAAVS